MTPTYVDIKGRSPHIRDDTTRSWVESIGRKSSTPGKGLVRPQIVLRMGTDTNHIRNATRTLYVPGDPPYHYKKTPYPRDKASTQAIMNNSLPGQKIPGLLNWSVSESLTQVTQTATFECLNCLPLSNVTTTVIDINPVGPTTNDGIGNNNYHADTIVGTWAQDSLFAVVRATGPGGLNSNGNLNIEYVQDAYGVNFREANVVYRLFQDQTFKVASHSGFPNPAIPNDDDNDLVNDAAWAQDVNGAGSYFLLVGKEVMRVSKVDSGGIFHVAAGGRGINGVIQAHSNGEIVTLLGHGKPTGEYCAMGYLSVDDFHPETAILRPGTCLTSYEGYGDIKGPLKHDFDPTRNYAFTGYWYVDSVQPVLGDDGVPRVTVSLQGVGAMYEDQKINLDCIQRMKNQFGQWNINGRTLFSGAGANRNIPGDWADYNAWDPTDQFSYPLQIRIEYAQHYAFFQHMQDTQNGLTCIQCRQELADYLKTHTKETARDRPVGKHIYKESIRVLRDNAGPIKTYIRLMATFAAASWDHPAYGTELSQKFTKIPNQLFDNIRNIFTGLCYNGQLDFSLATSDPSFDWTQPGYDDRAILSMRKPLTCPFQSSYDNAPFSQPMLDLAEVNGATFWVTREGYPCFKPYGWNMRPEVAGYRNLLANSKPDKAGPKFKAEIHHHPGWNGEWNISYGASIANYTSTISKDNIITQMWVTASTAFDIDNQSNSFTVTAGGTAYDDNGHLIFYSPLSGHKQGLMLTGGVQQIDTQTLDNQYLGLDWDTNPAGWGLVENEDGVYTQLNAKPALYDGNKTLDKDTKGVSEGLRRVQQSINFFLIRGYMDPVVVGSNTHFTLDSNGKWNDATQQGLVDLHSVLAHNTNPIGGVPGASDSGGTFTYQSRTDADDEYGRATANALKAYLDINAYYIKTDIWWYVRNGMTWDEYIASITGLPIPFQKGHAPKPRQTSTAYDTPLYVINQKALNKEITNWYKSFAQTAINIGNRKVNTSVDQAVQREIQTNLADPRIVPGDTIFCEVPGHLSSTSANGDTHPPFTNGIYVTSIARSLSLEGNGSYTASYSGTRQTGIFGKGQMKALNPKSDFIVE